MKILLYEWGSNSDNILKKTLIEMGYEVVVYDQKCEHYTKDLRFAQGLINHIHEHDAEGVISNDYFPIISMVCNTVGIPYYSWVYDSPHYTLFASTTKYSCNRIGCFDRALTRHLNALGNSTVRHLPLGVDWDCPDRNPIKDAGRYKCDVSFVGSMYTDAHNYYDQISDKEIRDRADELIKRQCFEYEKDYLSEFFFDGDKKNFEECEKYRGITKKEREPGNAAKIRDKVRDILAEKNLLPGDEYTEDIEYIFSSHFLEKKTTVEERHILLNTVAEKSYDLALYTGSDLDGEPGLQKVNKGIVDYQREMPIVFKNSRINLNITLRSIKTGIPLRALDIMGCGGFLLSNYQEELKECFREGEELVMFYSLEDCLEKIDYYLDHEDKRKNIAIAGKKAVEERFKYREQLRKLLDMA